VNIKLYKMSSSDKIVNHLTGVASELFNRNLLNSVRIIELEKEAARQKVANDLNSERIIDLEKEAARQKVANDRQLEETLNKLKRKAAEIVDMEVMEEVRARDHGRLLVQHRTTQLRLEDTTVRYFPPRVVQRC
jgi:autonomous glycyl radical cofactor GrcA